MYSLFTYIIKEEGTFLFIYTILFFDSAVVIADFSSIINLLNSYSRWDIL